MPPPEPKPEPEEAPPPSEDEKLRTRFQGRNDAKKERRLKRKQEKEKRAELPLFPEEEEETEESEQTPSETHLSDNYQLPPVELLTPVPAISSVDTREIEERKKQIQNCLDSFRIDADVGEPIHGPQVTLYPVHQGEGVHCSVFLEREKELQAALAVQFIRILAPVPNQSYIGIEVPNQKRETVYCREFFEGKAWKESRFAIPVILGKDIVGEQVLLDLAKAPHLLVAGTSGSGKSVGLQAIICSMLMKFSPEELKMILVDPKFVEFAAYKTLPHLLVPVVTDTQTAGLAMHWLIQEMEKRGQLLQLAGVKDLREYNRRPKTEEPVLDEMGEPIPDKLPFIVLIMDEFADMMSDIKMRKDLESSLQRLASKARFAGIHLILATQTPRVSVISGTIKGNFSMRIAYRCASFEDSINILGGKGAEQLLGQGDMLFGGGGDSPMRLQGVFLQEKEISALVKHCANQAVCAKSFEIFRSAEPQEEPTLEEKKQAKQDELLEKAVEIVVGQKATVTYLERRLGVGYNRAASLMESLEKAGIVSHDLPGTSGKREVLVKSVEEGLARIR